MPHNPSDKTLFVPQKRGIVKKLSSMFRPDPEEERKKAEDAEWEAHYLEQQNLARKRGKDDWRPRVPPKDFEGRGVDTRTGREEAPVMGRMIRAPTPTAIPKQRAEGSVTGMMRTSSPRRAMNTTSRASSADRLGLYHPRSTSRLRNMTPASEDERRQRNTPSPNSNHRRAPSDVIKIGLDPSLVDLTLNDDIRGHPNPLRSNPAPESERERRGRW